MKLGLNNYRSKELEIRLLYFTCPACGGYRLQEIATGLWTIREIESVRADGEIVYGAYEIDGGKRSFRCANCGYEIDDENQNYIEDGRFLANWFINRETI